MGDLTKDFSRREFASRFEGVTTPAPLPQVQRLADQLQVLRDAVGKSIHINSGYRTPAHNASVGGAKTSRHMVGDAADISVRNMAPADVYCATEVLVRQGRMMQGGLGAYQTHTHYDTRGHRSRWTTGVPTPNCRGVTLPPPKPTPPTPTPTPPEEEEDQVLIILNTNEEPGTYYLSTWMSKRPLAGMDELNWYRMFQVAEAKIPQERLDEIHDE